MFATLNWRHVAGSPSRRPGNFLLRDQKKVTKEEALNRTRASQALSTQGNDSPLPANTRTAALSLLSLSPASLIATAGRLTRGCTPGSREIQMQRRSGDATTGGNSVLRSAGRAMWRRPSDAAVPGEPGVQPALTVVKGRWMAHVTGTAARAQRVASARHHAERICAPLIAVSGWFAVQRLFFGDFLLAPQKKVTPLPGGTPGNVASIRSDEHSTTSGGKVQST
jgi:hypothetical protein